MTIRNKSILITGAASGIGKACALSLLKEGWQVVLVGRRADALAAAVAEAGPNAGHAHAIPTDLSKELEVKALFEQIRARFGRLDLVFNNAGISLPVTILDFFASAMLTAFELGIAETEVSGLSQVPESAALLCALPTWSPCMCDTRMMSILPSRVSPAPATVRPGS